MPIILKIIFIQFYFYLFILIMTNVTNFDQSLCFIFLKRFICQSYFIFLKEIKSIIFLWTFFCDE